MKVHEIYTAGAIHIPQSCTLQEAAVQMHKQHVGALIVTDGIDNRSILGVVTDRDIVLKAVAKGAPAQTTLVAEVMTPGAITISPSADLTDAMQAMFSHGVRRLVVTENPETLLGLVALDDIVEAMGRDWVLLSSVLRSGQQRERTGSVQSPLHP